MSQGSPNRAFIAPIVGTLEARYISLLRHGAEPCAYYYSTIVYIGNGDN